MADYEQSDANPGPLLAFGLAVLLLVAVSALAMARLQQAWRRPAGPLPAPTPLQLQPADSDPADLHRYQWIDRSQGLIQIPIEEAMRVVSQGGSRASDAATVPGLAPPAGGRDDPALRAAPGQPPAVREPLR